MVDGVKEALRSVSLTVRSDEFLVLMGPNGSGKSTLLSIIAGIVQSDSGSVGLVEMGKTIAVRKVGYVWQDYRASLLPWLSAVDNVAFPFRIEGKSRQAAQHIARTAIEEFLPDVDPAALAYKLSGGEQQLLCILRASVTHPDVLLLDEPLSALDQERKWLLSSFLEKLWRNVFVPTICVSHDVDEAILLADRILVLSRDGVLANEIRVDLDRPRSVAMLTSDQHIESRSEVLSALIPNNKNNGH